MIVDIVTVLFLLAFIFWGTRRGVIKMLLSAVSYLASIILGFVLCGPIASVLEGLGITSGLTARLTENISGIANLPGIMRDTAVVTAAETELASSVAHAAVNVISFLAVLVLARVVLMIVSLIMNVAGSMPVVKQTNSVLGGIGGFIIGMAIVLIVFGVVAMVEVFSKAEIAEELLGGSFLASLLYDNNPLLGLVVGK